MFPACPYCPALLPGFPATSGSASVHSGPLLASARRQAIYLAESNRRTTRHPTHHQHFPERITITRPHHPFEGQSLEVLRRVRMRAGLQFVLILPDGSKSRIPADWTDYQNPVCAAQAPQRVGSLEDFLRLRQLTDALLRRSTGLPVRSEASQEGHAATESEIQRHPHSGDAPVGTVRRRAETRRPRYPLASPRPSNAE